MKKPMVKRTRKGASFVSSPERGTPEPAAVLLSSVTLLVLALASSCDGGGSQGTGGSGAETSSATAGSGGSAGTGGSGGAACDADLMSDAKNCGTCGVSCPAGQVCAGGLCGCPIGTADCGGGVCVNTKTTNTHCGSCDSTCADVPGSVCMNGSCECLGAQLKCSGACIPNDDPGNCGMCGHACPPGASCNLGVCGSSPTTLATGQGAVALAVDASYVYWANPGTNANNYADGAIMKVPVGGGAPVVVTQATGPVTIALDASAIYWGGLDGMLRKMPIGGGAAVTLASGQPMNQFAGLVVDATNVYWTANVQGAVNTTPLGGGPITTLASNQNTTLALRMNQASLYWLSCETLGSNCTLRSVPKAGGGALDLASMISTATDLAVDETSVYWSGQDGVFEVPATGGAQATYAGEIWADSVAVDAAAVYWSIGTRVKKTGEIVLASTQQAKHLAVDGSSVYWVDGDAIMKTGK